MFSFSLQTLLEYRQRREEEAQMELAEAKRTLDREQRKRDLLCRREQESLAELNDTSKEARPAAVVASLILRAQGLARNRREQDERVLCARDTVSDCRKRLVTAMQEREMLDKLKERHQEAYLRDMMQKERKHSDESGRGRMVRREEPR